jgi:phasin family protein
MFTVDQIVAAQKANVEIFAGLTGRAFESVERLVELNLAASKAALADATENTKAALAAKDAQEFFSLQAGLVQPAAEKAAAYGRHVYDIAQGTAGDFAKAFEAQATAAQKKFAEAIDTAAANAPAGTESAVALVKSAYAAANNAVEAAQKAAKQAVDAAQANFDSVAATVTAAPVKASKKR